MRRDAVARLEVVLAVVADLRVAGVAAAEPAVPLLAAVVPAARVLAEVAADRALVAEERRGGEAGRASRPPRTAATSGARRARRASRSRRSAGAVAVGRDPAEPGVLQVDEHAIGVRMPRSIWPARSVPPPRARGAVPRPGARAPPPPIAGSCVRAHASASRTRSARQRQRGRAAPGRVRERVRDRGRGRDDRRLAEALRADVRQVRVGDVDEVDHDLGHVGDRRQLVVVEVRVDRDAGGRVDDQLLR